MELEKTLFRIHEGLMKSHGLKCCINTCYYISFVMGLIIFTIFYTPLGTYFLLLFIYTNQIYKHSNACTMEALNKYIQDLGIIKLSFINIEIRLGLFSCIKIIR